MTFRQPADNISSKKPCFGKQILLSAVIQILLIGIWVYTLRETSSYYSIYLFCAVAGIVCVLKDAREPVRICLRESWILLAFAVWFASTTVLANYKLFIVRPIYERAISAACALLGGTVTGYQIIRILAARIPFSLQKREKGLSPEKMYILSFCLMESIFLVYLFGVAYPAYFTPDVFNSIEQIVTGAYVNNNPFWYTISIKIIAGIGYAIFGSSNAAMAFYVFWQGVFMAAVFSYVLVTLYQIGVSKWGIIFAGAVYTLLPYNIAYSSTMLKDIPFSIASLLFIVSLYRMIRSVGKNQKLNYCFFGIGAFVFCLMRTNGLASFLVTILVVLLLLRESRKRSLVILVAVILVITWILTGPVLKIINVGSTNYVEGLAVPFQQIGRVIAMGYELDPYEYELLNRIFDVELIPEVFMHWSVDPIKGDAFRSVGREYLKENIGTYAKLWIQMGKKYPGEYLKAWIELTKGYWNGGYKYWVYYLGGYKEAFGIIRPDAMPLEDFFNQYFSFVEGLVISQPFYSIGLHTWILIGCLVLNIKKKRTELVLAIPGLVILLGLWLGTPVYSEFRYAYPMILPIPLVICTTIYQYNKE